MSIRSLAAWLAPAALALSAAAHAEPPARGVMVQRVYPVADLVIPVGDVTTTPCPVAECPTAQRCAPACFPGRPCPVQCPAPTPVAAAPVPCLVPVAATAPAPCCQPCPASPKCRTVEDQLIKLITSTVQPESWEDNGGAAMVAYNPIGMALVVQQTPNAHEQIAALLESLRRLQDVQVAVEVRIISLSDCVCERIGVDFDVVTDGKACQPKRAEARLPFEPCRVIADIARPDAQKVVFLNDREVTQFLEAMQGDRRSNVMQAPKVTMFNGQQSAVNVVDRQFFVTGLKVVPVNGQAVLVPQNEEIETGVKLSLRPTVSADRRYVRLEVNAKLTELEPHVPLMPVTTMVAPTFEGGAQGPPVPFTQFIQQPKVNTSAMEGTVCLMDGKTALLYGGKRVREVRSEYGPPVLSKIPYVNRLFKNVGIGHEEESLLVMVTPRVIVAREQEEARPTAVVAGVEEQTEPAEPPMDPKLAKLMEKYRQACSEGRAKAAKKLAERCLAIDPTCFGKDR
jgi:type II secretory pathway component GspD/PulD (secretin)